MFLYFKCIYFQNFDGNSGQTFVYRTQNPYATSPDRFIWFYGDPPHCMKTARNCISKSGKSNSSRRLWNNGLEILWEHITSLHNENLNFGIKLVSKLTSDYVHLTSYSVMNVRLAVQVLSETVGKVLSEFSPPEAAATSKFCLMMDKYFDCMNVRNINEHKVKRKPFLKPYESLTDERFSWLENDLLGYFKEWKQSIKERPGNFNATHRNNMFISYQTYESISMSVFSLKESVTFLLKNGVKYVLSERFCQDDLENYFGRQRAIGCRRDNPRVVDIGYNDNTIKSQFSIRPILGNVRAKEQNKFDVNDDTPLPKRNRSASNL